MVSALPEAMRTCPHCGKVCGHHLGLRDHIRDKHPEHARPPKWLRKQQAAFDRHMVEKGEWLS